MMAEEYLEEVKETSIYNEASLQIMRLHELWQKAEYYASKGNLEKWRFTLDAVERELHSDVLRADDSKKTQIKYEKILRKITGSKKRNVKYFWIQCLHKFLKQIQDSSGKGGSYGQADTEAMD